MRVDPPVNERVLTLRTVRDLAVAQLRNMAHRRVAKRQGCPAVDGLAKACRNVRPTGDLIVRH